MEKEPQNVDLSLQCDNGANNDRQEPAIAPHSPRSQKELDCSHPQPCKVVADYFGVGKRTIQTWFSEKICPTFHWLKPEALRLPNPDNRYTPDCLKAMLLFRQAVAEGRTFADWQQEIWSDPENSRYSQTAASAPVTDLDVPDIAITMPDYRTVSPGSLGDFDFDRAMARLDGARGEAFESSQQVVDAVEQLLNGVSGALKSKVERQTQKVQSDRKQLYRFEALREDFDRRVTRLGVRSQSLAGEQTEVTTDIQDSYQEIADMGKPSAEDSSS